MDEETPLDFSPSEMLPGVFDIEFVGDPHPRRIDIWSYISSYDAGVLYLIGQDKKVYNWSTVIWIKKVED